MKSICHTDDSVNLVNFATQNPGWNSFSNDKRTMKAVERAELLGRIEVSRETSQFRLSDCEALKIDAKSKLPIVLRVKWLQMNGTLK